MDESIIEEAITDRTKEIVPVHFVVYTFPTLVDTGN